MMHQPAAVPPSLSLGDIYYVLFRHKWKIIGCSLAGIAVAVTLLWLEPVLYQSEAKLLVRYIISESKMTGPNANSATAKIMTDERGESIMSTEREILSSIDLAREVVQALGAEKLLAKSGGGKDVTEAVKLVRTNLRVLIQKGSSVVSISFRHPDAEIVQTVVREIIDRYLKLHVLTHRASGMLGDTLAQEADTLRSRLAQTEDDLRKATSKAGVISLESAKEAYSTQMTAIRREILSYEAELAARVAVLQELKKRTSPAAPTPEAPAEPEVPLNVVDQYRSLSLRIGRLQNLEQELSVQFTAENARVKQAQSQLAEAEGALKSLRDQYPRLARSGRPSSPTSTMERESDPSADETATAWIQITAYQAKVKELSAQFERIRAEATKLDQMEGPILELRRKKELEEANYRYYAANLEQARISETLGNGKVSNISQIQAASNPFRELTNYKTSALSAVGGILAGLAWAFLIELYLDRSVRRPSDLSRIARAPLFLSIPQLKVDLEVPRLGGPKALELTGQANDAATPSLAPESKPAQALIPFHETLRDRLISFFESKNLTHKPKLVAVTGLLSQSGVTTTAAGLARSLSETGDGNVLLVDMTVGQGAAQQFTQGKATCGIDDLLEARSQAHVHENLYVVAEFDSSDRLSRNMPKRFARLVPKLKASDFDYIIFDMPTVSQLSITPRLASFMDIVLLVIESEKTDRQLVQGACDLLAESKVHIGVVLNKTRNYVPARLQHELMAN